MVQVDERAVEPVGQASTAGAGAEGVIRAEHDVVGEQLGAAVEQLPEGLLAAPGVELILLVDPDPGEIQTPRLDLLVSLRLLSLEPCKLLPGRPPFPAGSDLVLGHGASSGQTTPMRLPVRAKLITARRARSATGPRRPGARQPGHTAALHQRSSRLHHSWDATLRHARS